MKILNIKKRNAIACAFTIEHYKVTVETDDGSVKTVNCWAGRDRPEAENILFDLDKHLGTRVFEQHLQGTEVEIFGRKRKIHEEIKADGFFDRYTTKTAALKGHDKIVRDLQKLQKKYGDK